MSKASPLLSHSPRRKLLHAAGERRRIWKPCAFGQPLAHTGCANPAGDDAHRHVEALRHGIAKWRDETAAPAARAGLGIVGELPAFAVERGDLAGLGGLLFLAVIGGVGLSGDDEHLAHADMFDCGFRDNLVAAQSAHFQAIPTAGRNSHRCLKRRFLK